MANFSSLITKINDLKTRIEAYSISPLYLGTLFDEMVTLMKSLDVGDNLTESINKCASDLKALSTDFDTYRDASSQEISELSDFVGALISGFSDQISSLTGRLNSHLTESLLEHNQLFASLSELTTYAHDRCEDLMTRIDALGILPIASAEVLPPEPDPEEYDQVFSAGFHPWLTPAGYITFVRSHYPDAGCCGPQWFPDTPMHEGDTIRPEFDRYVEWHEATQGGDIRGWYEARRDVLYLCRGRLYRYNGVSLDEYTGGGGDGSVPDSITEAFTQLRTRVTEMELEQKTIADRTFTTNCNLQAVVRPVTGYRPDGLLPDDGPGMYLHPGDGSDPDTPGRPDARPHAYLSFGPEGTPSYFDSDRTEWEEYWQMIVRACGLFDNRIQAYGIFDFQHSCIRAKDGLYSFPGTTSGSFEYILVTNDGTKCIPLSSLANSYSSQQIDSLLSQKASLDHTHTDFRALEWQIETLSAKINDNLGGVRIACLRTVYDYRNNKSLEYNLVTCEEWKDLYDSIIAEEVYPIGIWVPIDGHRPVIVAPKVLYGYDYCTFLSNNDSAAFVLDEVSFSNECDAFTDFDRDARRNHAITHYADKASSYSIAGFAASYNPLKDIKNAPTFNWWLPTLGELMAIFRHLPAIDKCLCALGGYPVVQNLSANFISSTAYKYQDKDNEHFWCLSLKKGISCVCAYFATPINALLVTSYPTRVLQE